MAKSVRICELCGGTGKVVETRERDGMVRRRLRCARGHRFTTVEIKPRSTAKRALTAMVRKLAVG